MAELLRSARNAIVRNVFWGGKQPVKLMDCFQAQNERLVVCKAHPTIEVPRTCACRSPPRKANEARFGKNNTGHFTLANPLFTIASAGSLNAIKVGTLPLSHEEAEVLFDAPNIYAYVDKSALNVRPLQERTRASDVFQDWPLEFTMHSGYTFWSVPLKVDEDKSFMFEVRPEDSFGIEHDSCQEMVVLDRPNYIRVAMSNGSSREEAERAADGIRFKVAVELDFSALGLANCLFFLPPGDAKNPTKVVEEMSNPSLRGVPELDMSKMRLVPHPRLKHCCSCNWFKVVPKDQAVSWEYEVLQGFGRFKN